MKDVQSITITLGHWADVARFKNEYI